MTSDAETLVRLRRLLAELRVDLEALCARHREVVAALRGWDAGAEPERTVVIVTAVNLHGWYTALEHGLERVARLVDQTLPSGSTWHVELLAQMQLEIPELRPAVIPAGVASELNELRKFRHFFRNAYVLELDPTRVRARALDLAQAHPPVEAGWRGLLEHVQAALTMLRES